MADEIKVGQSYITRARGNLVVVRIDEITVDAAGQAAYIATNLKNPTHKMILGANTKFTKGGAR